MRPPFQNVKRRGPEIAFLANQFARAEFPLHDRAGIQFQKRAGDAFEDGNLQKLFGVEHLRICRLGNGRTHHAAIGQRTSGAGNHALAAGNTRGFAHRRIQVKRNSRGITLAHAAQHEIVFNLIAPANAAVAQNTRVVIHGDGQRRFIPPARYAAFRKPRLLDPRRVRLRFQFAIARMLLPRAWRGVVGHQQLQHRLARAQNLVGIRDHLHSGINGPHTRRR